MKTKILALMLVAAVFTSCKDDDSNDIAQYPVDFTIYLNEPAYINLNAVGGSIYLSGVGTKGIIIYRKSTTEFNAVEQNCSFDPDKACSKVKIESGITAKDSCCGSKFSIYDGSVISGPAARPLFLYQTVYNQTSNSLYVHY